MDSFFEDVANIVLQYLKESQRVFMTSLLFIARLRLEFNDGCSWYGYIVVQDSAKGAEIVAFLESLDLAEAVNSLREKKDRTFKYIQHL